MNFGNEVEVDKYSENPEALILLVESVLNKLLDSINDSDLRQKQAQLIEVTRSIDQLTKLSIPIPDELRNLKLNLLAEIEVTSESREELTNLLTGIGNIVARIESSYLSKPSKRKRTRTRTTKSPLPFTNQKELRGEIIDALRIMGGSALAIEVKDIIEERMKDKFLPGDLEINPSTHMLVWKTHVHVARQGLKSRGILRSDSPVGTWELAEGHK